MGKIRFDPPTDTFPYKIKKRFNMLSRPRPIILETDEGMPSYTPQGVRQSALRGHISDRLNDAAWPYLRRLLVLKRQYKSQFSLHRLERIDRMIESINTTMYSKMANCTINLKHGRSKESKKKRAWTESEWKKHSEYLAHIAAPRRQFKPPPVSRGTRRTLDELIDRIEEISKPAEFKIYKRLSKEAWYRDPVKVAPGALKYVATDRVKVLATPKPLPQADDY